MTASLQGRWYLIHTNFSMWKHSNVCNVTFNYTSVQKDGVNCLLDEVKYVKNGKPDAIVGYDFFDAADPSKFIWQGKGWMFWIKCPWKIEWVNAAQTCIVLSFEKTLLTGGGVDVVTREKHPSETLLAEALAVINSHESLRKNGQKAMRVLQQ